MKDDNDKNNNKIKFQSLIICCCLFLMGLIISTLIFIFYPNEILCKYTKNELLCYEETKICNEGYWGNECIKCLDCKNGICDGSGTNTGSGNCICTKGWKGELCDQCDIGYYGNNCTKCNSCENNGICNGSNTLFGNGKCICSKPFTGEFCNKCLNNNYGINCSKKCNNKFCLRGECYNGIRGNGKCLKCPIGYKGDYCDQCDSNYIKDNNNQCKLNLNITKLCLSEDYGYSITDDKYGDCRTCPKNYLGKICSDNGVCDGKGSVFGTGYCNCNDNFVGLKCEYTGILVNTSKCDKSCNNNGICLISNNKYFCNCQNNYTGLNCSKCSVGYIKNDKDKCVRCSKGSNYWGSYCQPCNCNNNDKCDDGINGTGSCNCKKGWKGIYCDQCKMGHYGKKCKECPNCNHGICDDTIDGNGKCVCNKGYTGEFCDQCIKGFIKNRQYCEECPGSYGGKQNECFGNGKCTINNEKVKCVCKSGYYGNSCSQKINNCSYLNYCNNNGKCINSLCYCNNEFYGDYCNMTSIEYFKSFNNTNFYRENLAISSYQNIKSNIENNYDNNKDRTGEHLAISISIVFGFVAMTAGIGYFFKYRTLPTVKNFSTNLTRSKTLIELTKEEKELITENPILKLKDTLGDNYLTDAYILVKKAIDEDNNHNFEKAVDLYKKSIDKFMIIMKYEKNASDRFALAKRLDTYIKRCNFLEKFISNGKLLNECIHITKKKQIDNLNIDIITEEKGKKKE